MEKRWFTRRTRVGIALIMIIILVILGAPNLILGTFGGTKVSYKPLTLPAPSYQGFDADHLIEDADFYQGQALSEPQIRAFIGGVGHDCQAAIDQTPCLKDAVIDLPAFSADKYCDAIPARPGTDVAGLISQVGRACNISPAALLVILQKEQGLLTATGDQLTPRRYQAAMGYACPEHAPCDPDFEGIVNQVYYGARQFNLYRARPEKYEYQAGKTSAINYSTDANCGQTTVTPVNDATAGLYNYTPHPPLPQTLQGDAPECETWGNLNFYSMYQTWFKSGWFPATAEAPAQ